MKRIKYVGARSALAVAIAAVALAGCDDDESVSINTNSLIQIAGGLGGTQAGQGGRGGHMSVIKTSGPGNVVIQSTGGANATVPRPSITIEYGESPVTITGSRTLAAFTEGEPEAGQPYRYEGGIYVSNGNGTLGDETRASSLIIASGATLVVEPMYNQDGEYPSNDTGELSGLTAIEINGTLRSGNSTDGERGRLYLVADYITGNGAIDVSGTDNPADDDALDAGDVSIETYVYLGGGLIKATGGNNSDGDAGQGGDVSVYSEVYLHNQASIDLDGGDATGAVGYGGDGGYATLLAYGGAAINAGAMHANGGDGVWGGGDGGSLYLAAAYGGPAFNSADLVFNGGAARDGYGGQGGGLYAMAMGNQLRNSGALTARGGDGGGDYGSGGNGGYLQASSMDGWILNFVEETETRATAKNVAWSGGIDLRGGNAAATKGGQGGYGGEAFIGNTNDEYNWNESPFFELDYENFPSSTVTLYGYASLDASGGNGNRGGMGGGLEVSNESFYQGSTHPDYSGGEVDVEVLGGGVETAINVTANGGNALAGLDSGVYGGEGGYLDLYATESDDYYAYSVYGQNSGLQTVTHAGTFTGNGGESRDSSYAYANAGGGVDVWAEDVLSYTGAIVANGGRDVVTNGDYGYGGAGGYAQFGSNNAGATVKGNASLEGASGAYVGGWGGRYVVNGATVVHDGAVSVDGGDSSNYGGSGGWVEVMAEDLFSAHTGTVSYAGGTGGDSNGDEGCFVLDSLMQGTCYMATR